MRERQRMHHEGGHHHHEGGPPWARHWRGNMFFGPPWGGGRRARRGDVRTGILTLLDEKPMHGYDLIRELEERSGGAWRPSPGSVYPTLQMLEDEGLISGQDQDGKRVFTLTDAGRTELGERRDRNGGAAPWEFGGLSEGVGQLLDAISSLAAAAMQVGRTGTDAQRTKAAEILAEARKKLYSLLAED